MKRMLLLPAVVLCSSWILLGCSDNGEAHEPGVTSGVVSLPDGSPASMSTIQVVTTFSASVPEANGSYSAKVADDQGHLVMAVAEDTNRNVRMLLMRISRPNVDGALDTESTAEALVMLAPFIVHHKADILGEIEDVIAKLPEVTALAGAIENGLSSGKYLDEISSDQGFKVRYSEAISAAITALKAAATTTRKGSLSQSRFALKIDPEEEVSGIQLVPDDVDDNFITVNNRGRRWLSVYAGAPGSDELLAIAESPPSILSLESIFQATVLTKSEVSIDITNFSGIIDTRVYGPGLGTTQPQCGRPAYTDVRILIPTIATVLDNFVSPLLNIISGLDLSSLDIYQDFLVSVAIGVWTNTQCLEEVLDLDGEVDWSSLAWCVLEETSNALLETAMKIVLTSGDMWVGHGKKGPKFKTFTNAMAKVLDSGGNVDSIEMLALDDSFIVKILSAAGLGVLQITVKAAVLPVKVISMAASAFELGGAVGTVLASSPAECFSVDMEDGTHCIDNDEDGYGVGADCLGPDCDDNDNTIHTGCTCTPDCTGLECGNGGCTDQPDACGTCLPSQNCINGLCELSTTDLVWIQIPGGTYMMGSNTGNADEQPVHQVTVPEFEMSKTEVTVSQYAACVDFGSCAAPNTEISCNWGVAGLEDHPVNCVDWQQAVDFCTWAGGRLPSEAEWEYAARGGGQDIIYPWGNDSPNCSLANYTGCEGGTWSSCSAPAGNTSQGLCDMGGNVWEWMKDWYHSNYTGAPADGSAWESPVGTDRVLRGSAWGRDADYLRASSRRWTDPSNRDILIGFRCAR